MKKGIHSLLISPELYPPYGKVVILLQIILFYFCYKKEKSHPELILRERPPGSVRNVRVVPVL